MIGKRTRQPAAIAAEPNDDQAAKPETVPADLAAAAEQIRNEAADVRARASGHRADASARVTEAREEAARLIASAEAETRSLAAEAASADHEAEKLEEHAGYLAEAASQKAQGEEVLQRASALVEERDSLTARIGELAARLGQLSQERQELTGQLAAATGDADIDAITSLQARVTSIDTASSALTGQRKTAQDRADAIGDGRDRGELHNAIRAASQHAGVARKMLNRAFPGRPEALADRLRDELQGALTGNLERIAQEAKRKPPAPQIVML